MIARAGALGVVLVACLATSAPPPRPPRPFLAWTLAQGPAVEVGCARSGAWVSKSGKTGVGVTVRVENTTGTPCQVALDDARFRVADAAWRAPVTATALTDGAGRPSPGPIPPCEVRFAYVGFAFDNDAAWRAGQDAGAFEVRLAGEAGTATLTAVAHQGAIQPAWEGSAMPGPFPGTPSACATEATAP